MTDFTAIKAEFSLLDVASRYVELKRHGSEYTGLCPFHDDSRPSLSVYVGGAGYQRYRCFACGADGDVLDFVQEIENCDLETAVRKLSGGELPPVGTHKPPPAKVSQAPLWQPILPVPSDAPDWTPSMTFNPKSGKTWPMKPVRKDPYLDAQGRLLFYVARVEWEDGRKMTPMITWCKGPEGRRAWCSRYIEPPYPLMGLDQLAARPKDMVVVVSGEKCYAYAKKHMPQFVAVSWPRGDDAIEQVDVSPLKGRWLVYWPDADSSGCRAMLSLHNMLARLNQGAPASL